MKILKDKYISDVNGILTCGVSCGLKKDSKKDLSIIYSKSKAVAVAVFTSSKAMAAPIIVSRDHIRNENTQAIVINSGNANSCNGEAGIRNSQMIADTAAKYLKLSPREVLVASTGVIGEQLPMNLILPGIEMACSVLPTGNGIDAANAILTTDTCIKTITAEFYIDGKPVRISAMAKGSTMIHPNMGTLLSFVVTDCNISKGMLDKALKQSVEKSYNMISIDGETSTNDMVIVLANGASGHSLIESENENYITFCEVLDFINIEMAKKIASDGEGSTKLLEVEVLNAPTVKDARLCAKAVVSSILVKCAILGSAADWPRIMNSLGYSGANYNPGNIDISIGNGTSELMISENSTSASFDKNYASSLLGGNLVKVKIDLKDGNNHATAWGCDLGFEYLKANAYLTGQ